MRRGNRHSENPNQNPNENSHRLENVPASTLDTKKLRKIKEFKDEIRCRSARPRSASHDSKSKPETSRTRSVSPGPYVPPLDVQLPLEKFYKLYSKIVVQLETVKNFTENKTNETENLIDLRRQLQRADEFSIRFSRNNLYEAKRIINDIKQLIVPYPFEGLSPGDCKVLSKKVILAYQSASQSLQTYINYAKNPSNLEVPDKINELVLLIADLFLCCEHLSLPADEVFIQSDAIKVCNELMALLKAKLPVCEYVDFKEADLTKKTTSISEDDTNKIKKLSMYKKKLTPKVKVEAPKKKFGMPCLLGTKARKMKKSEEKKARITHEIYTQKMNPRKGKELGSKNVKFEPEKSGKEVPEDKKLFLRRPRYVTPREVRSQDDDVETMVQTIGNDDGSIYRLGSTPREIDDLSDVSSSLKRSSFRDLLIEAIEELQNPYKKESKATLKKLLNSIQNCSKNQPDNLPNPERVKVFHFISQDPSEEPHNDEQKLELAENKQKVDSESIEKSEEKPKLKGIFKPLYSKGEDDAGEPLMLNRVKLKLSEETMINASKYRKAFSEYRKNNIMYKKTFANKPWELVDKMSDRIILDLIKEVSLDLQSDAILRRLYLNELQEVLS